MKQSSKFYYQTKILEHHIDIFGHVNNAITLQILEIARWDFITQGNFGVNYIKEKNIGPVILELGVRFKKELLLREDIEIVSINYWDEKSIWMETVQEIYKKNSHQLATVAKFKVGMMDLKKRKLMDFPDDWKMAVGFSVE